MILYYTELSPFARKVRMVALHHGLDQDLRLEVMMPLDRPPELMKVNPLGKIPVLLLPEGRSLIDSPVICQYLDAVGPNEKLVPADVLQRVQMLHLEALADGILDAAVLMVLESRRPEQYRWPHQFDKQTDNILRALAALEAQADFFHLPFSLAHVAAGAAIDYIHHRLPTIGIVRDWLEETPQLAAWYQHIRGEDWLRRTAPKDGW